MILLDNPARVFYTAYVHPTEKEGQRVNIHDFRPLSDNWRSQVMSSTTMQKGREYFYLNRALVHGYNFAGSDLVLYAKVKSKSRSVVYDVNFHIDPDGDLTEYECTCPAYADQEGACKHCVATFLAYTDLYKKQIAPMLEKDNAKAAAAQKVEPETRQTTIFESPEEAYARRQEEKRLEKLNEQEKIALNRTTDVLSRYAGSVLNNIRRGALTAGSAGVVALVPMINLSELSQGIFLSMQIRKRNPDERSENTAYDPPTVAVSAFPRSYVIRDIGDFLVAIEQNREMRFGKELAFRASEDALDDISRRWLLFLRRRYSQCAQATDYSRLKLRQIRLMNPVLDELFEQFNDCYFREDDASQQYRKVLCADAPTLELSLSQNKEGAFVLSCDRIADVYTGLKPPDYYPGKSYYSEENRAYYTDINEQRKSSRAKYLYMREKGQLRRFSQEASDALFPLALALIDARGKLRFSPEQRAGLFTHLLPEISQYAQVKDRGKLIEKYGADDMTGMILLDAPSRESVSAELFAGYRGIWLDMYSGKPVGRTSEDGDASQEGKTAAQVKVNWDAAGIDAGGIRRDLHAEQRFLAQAGGILGFEQSDLVCFLEPDDTGALKAGSAQEPIIISGNDRLYSLLSEGMKKLQEIGDVLVSEKLRNLSVEPPRRMTVGVTLDSGLLKINIDSGDISLQELQSLLRAYRDKKRYYRLKNGNFIRLDSAANDAMTSVEELDRVGQGLQIDASDIIDGVVEVPAFRAMYLDGLFNDAVGLDSKRDAAFRALTERVRNFAHAEFEVPPSLENVLRNYQKTGYRWMRCLESCNFCGILADDMGLGKSVQFISVLLARELTRKDRLPSLIVCPSSLVLNWKHEIEKFAPSLHVRVIQGLASGRAARMKEIEPGDIVITSYDLLKRDLDAYKDVKFYYFAIDEAQYIKNHTTQAAKAVKKVNCRQRFALTGTPIENRLSELWSIFDFLMPGYLYKYTRFREQFEAPIAKDGNETAKSNLRKMIMPFVLRRMKSEVLTELPPKTTTVVPVELAEKQMEAYNAMLLTGLEALKGDEKRTEGIAKMQVLALLTRLRRLCCDPSLCFDSFQYESSKLEACMELLNQAKEGGHKTLLFSQYTDMLDIIEKRVKQSEMSSLRLQGSTPVKDRLELVDAFNRGETDVFLISLKAGGTGLNLTAADTVIHYDPWWNLAAQDQATDRAHRIGQEKNVQVYKLIAQNTIEEKILKLQEMKKDLAAIVDSDEGEGGLMTMSADEIIGMLKNR